MISSTYLSFLLALVAVATSTVSGANAAPNATQVYIEGITYNGTGCPSGSIGSFLSSDRQSFTLIFDSYQVQIGPGTPVTANLKLCDLSIDLRYPKGYEFWIVNTTFSGYAALQSGAASIQSATYHYPSLGETLVTQVQVKGPISADFSRVFTPIESIVAPCGNPEPLIINTWVRMTSTVASAVGVFPGVQDETDWERNSQLVWTTQIAWDKCSVW